MQRVHRSTMVYGNSRFEFRHYSSALVCKQYLEQRENLKSYLYEQQLHCRYVKKISMYSRLPDVRSKHISDGTVPVSLKSFSKSNFSEKSKVLWAMASNPDCHRLEFRRCLPRRDNRPSSDGILPVKELSARYSSRRFERLPSSVGSAP